MSFLRAPRFRTALIRCSTVLLVIGSIQSAWAGPFRLLLEADDPANDQGVFAASPADFDAIRFFNPLQTPTEATGLALNPAFSIAGMAYDGQYRLLLEREADAGLSDIFSITADSFDDIRNGNGFVNSQFSSLNLNPSYDLNGFAYDGQYHALLESRDDAAVNEVILASWDSYENFLSGELQGAIQSSTLNLAPQFDIAGFAYDGAYRVMLESNIDAGAGQEIFTVNFSAIDDLLNGNIVGALFDSTLNIGPAYSVGAFAFETNPAIDVPAPTTLSLLLAGLVLLRRRVQRPWGTGCIA